MITGDLLTNGIPNVRSGYPVEWTATLDGIDKLAWDNVIPGHGNVQQGKAQLESLLAYFKRCCRGRKRLRRKRYDARASPKIHRPFQI